jgi:hypothetical protein
MAVETWPEQRPQRQDSLTDQLIDLHRVAARLGMYDAADWLWPHIAAVVQERLQEPLTTDPTPQIEETET